MNLHPLFYHFAQRYTTLSLLLALSAISTLLVAFLFPLFLGAVAKHGAKAWVVLWFFVGALWLVGTTFIGVHVEVDLKTQSTHYINSLFLKHTYLHYDYAPNAWNPSMKDLHSARSAFVGLTKLAAHTYLPFLVGNLGSALYVFYHDARAGTWFALIYAWTVVFPFLTQRARQYANNDFPNTERSLYLGTQLVLEKSSARRTFNNFEAPARYVQRLHNDFSRSATAVTSYLLYQSALYLAVLALFALALVRSLQRNTLTNATRVTILSMFVFNLKQVGKYLEDMGEFVKHSQELQRALPEQYGVLLNTLDPVQPPLAVRSVQPEEVVLVARDVQYFYGEHGVFQDGPLSFSCRAGERTAVVGCNGRGKSTLLQLIAHRLPFKGTIQILDHTFSDELSSAPFVAYYEQNQLGWGPWSVEENLIFVHPNLDAPQIRAAVTSWSLEWVIDEFPQRYDTPLSNLSIGQRQFVAVLQVLLKRAPLVLLDEFTSAMNERYTQALTELLDHHPDFKHCTLIFVTHDEKLRSKLSTRYVTL